MARKVKEVWICRTWILTRTHWVSDYERFPSLDKAKAYAELFVNLQGENERAREYELYRE